MKKLSFTTIISFFYLISFAQDPHFSQYFASPLSLNPANTGYFNGDYRVCTNLRQQWANVNDGYYTGSLTADIQLLKGTISEIDNLAIGVLAINDQSLNGALNNSYYALSLSYHKGLSYQNNQSLGIGIQVGYIDKILDYSKLSFASQFDGREFDLSIPSGVNYERTTVKNLDLNLGILYDLKFSHWNGYLGSSIYHITQPNESLFGSKQSKLPFRTTFHAGGSVELNNYFSIILSGAYNKQGNTKEILYGSLIKLNSYSESNVFSLYAGVWNRVNDAIIPYLGLDFNQWSAGINYGINSNKVLNYKPRTFELSLIFRKNSNSGPYDRCPRF